MPENITPVKIRANNRLSVYQLIYNRRRISQPEISYTLHLSRPTVTTLLEELRKQGLIKKDGVISSEMAGRKAAAYTIVSDYRIAAGIHISPDSFRVVLLDLYGETIASETFPLLFDHTESSMRTICEKVLSFFTRKHISSQTILGIGITMPAVISPDGSRVVYGPILSNTGMTKEYFTNQLPSVCTFLREADSAAVSELWSSPEIDSAVYLLLSDHVGASLITNRMIVSGKHGHSASVEHLRLKSGGKKCYCGRQGCMETLCSTSAVLKESESIEEFAAQCHQEGSDAAGRWKSFLTELSHAIYSLHLICDTDFIIGGTLARCFSEEDRLFLYHELMRFSLYGEPDDFIRIGTYKEDCIPAGAALPYIWSFLANPGV